MSEQIQKEGLSLSDIFKLFLSKIKLLIIVLICGCIVGGLFGVVSTNGVNYYGTSLEFYINPESPEDSVNSDSTYGVYGAYGKHVMDNMVKLLSSQVFAEQLILNGKDLPEKDKWVDTENETETALNLNEKIDAAQAKVDAYNDALAALNTKVTEKNKKVADYNDAYAALKAEWQDLFKNGTITSSASFSEVEYLKLTNKTDSAYASLVSFYDKWVSLSEDVTALDGEISAEQKTVSGLKADRDAAVNEALSAWRKTAAYKSTLNQYLESVSFSYIGDGESIEDAADLARSFIYVSISVLGDENKAFAEDLMTRIQVQVPKYVSENMVVPTGYSGTRCIEITTTSGIVLTNPSYTRNSAIKFALIGGLAALVIACVVLIIIDSSDKRVRNYEQISRYLKVPLLGIIPSIEEEQIDAWHDNVKKGKGAQL